MSTYPLRWMRTLFWLSAFILLSLSLFVLSAEIPSVVSIGIYLIVLFNLYIETMVSLAFISPASNKKSMHEVGWEHHDFAYENVTTHAVCFLQESRSPLIVIIHGWRSTSASVAGRANWFAKKGWHVVVIELPGHGLSSHVSTWTAIRASEHVENTIRHLDTIIADGLVENFLFYGHSIGGYICTRVSNIEKISPFEVPLEGLILESPMLLYSKIYSEIVRTFRIPKFLQPFHMKRCLKLIRKMHPWYDGDSLDSFDIPRWALPIHPTLCVQSMNDRRLGRIHYDTLVAHMEHTELLEHHLVESLTHSGAQFNADRERIIENWIEKF